MDSSGEEGQGMEKGAEPCVKLNRSQNEQGARGSSRSLSPPCQAVNPGRCTRCWGGPGPQALLILPFLKSKMGTCPLSPLSLTKAARDTR